MKSKRRTILISTLLICTLIVLLLIKFLPEEKKFIIAISQGSGSDHYTPYSLFLENSSDNVECIDLYALGYKEALDAFENCSGLLLSGGSDVHPGRYGKEYDTARCEIDLYRDTLEFAVIKRALEKELPILAICRGEQILNVALGGSLIVDIRDDFDTTVTHQCIDSENCFHEITISENTLLHKICGVSSGLVNTNHHQAVDILADDLIVSARTNDNLIEAYEWEDSRSKPFLLAVQWHPERLSADNPLGTPIAKYFLKMIEKYKVIANK